MGIAAVDMSEKNNKSNSPADNTKSEKKMTKYDLKMQRRQEEEKKAKKEKAIIKTGCILAVIICVCIAAWKFYDLTLVWIHPNRWISSSIQTQ